MWKYVETLEKICSNFLELGFGVYVYEKLEPVRNYKQHIG